MIVTGRLSDRIKQLLSSWLVKDRHNFTCTVDRVAVSVGGDCVSGASWRNAWQCCVEVRGTLSEGTPVLSPHWPAHSRVRLIRQCYSHTRNFLLSLIVIAVLGRMYSRYSYLQHLKICLKTINVPVLAVGCYYFKCIVAISYKYWTIKQSRFFRCFKNEPIM